MSDAAWRKQVAQTASASAKGAAVAVAKAAAAVAAALAEDAAALPKDEGFVHLALSVGDGGEVVASLEVVAVPSAAARRARYESFLFEPAGAAEPTDAEWRAGVASTTAANAAAASTAVASAAVGTAMAAHAKWEKDAPWRAGVRLSLAQLPTHAQAAVKEAAGAVARALADDVPRRYSSVEWPREYSVSAAADAAVAAQKTAGRQADALALSVATELGESAVLDALAPYKAAEEAAAADAARAKAEAWQQATAARARLESFAAEPSALRTPPEQRAQRPPNALSPVASSRGGSARASKLLGGFTASAPASARSSKLLSPRGVGGGAGATESPRQVGVGVWLKADV